MKLAKDKKILICISLIMLILVISVIAISKNKFQTNAEWAKAIGGNKPDYITCISNTNDGGYVAGGYFQSTSIELGNEVVLNFQNGGATYAGMIIKYNSEGVAQWAKTIEGSGFCSINTIISTEDGGYVI